MWVDDVMSGPDWLDRMGFTQEQKETILRVGAEHEFAMPGITWHIARVCSSRLRPEDFEKLGIHIDPASIPQYEEAQS